MTQDSTRPDGASRRKFILSAGALGVGALAGCSGGSESTENQPASNDTPTATGSQTSSDQWGDVLTAGGSSTVYPITNMAASYWNYNAPPDDADHWPHEEYNIDAGGMPFADYWADQAGYDADGDAGTIPWHVAVGLSHSGTGINKVMKGQLDIGDASAPVTAELPDKSDSFYNKFVDHVVGIDAMQITVSQDIYDNGVTELTSEEVVQIYTGQITNWKDVGGPDEKIQVVGRVKGSGTRTIFHTRLLEGKEASAVKVHKGENQQVASTVRNSNNAIGYVGYAFIGDGNPSVDLKIDGTIYNQENGNLGKKDYLLNRDLHCYTYEDTPKMASAFLNMIMSDMGQSWFVESNNYIALPDNRRENQISKLNL